MHNKIRMTGMNINPDMIGLQNRILKKNLPINL